jgi:hypothetical protein
MDGTSRCLQRGTEYSMDTDGDRRGQARLRPAGLSRTQARRRQRNLVTETKSHIFSHHHTCTGSQTATIVKPIVLGDILVG